MRTKPQPRIPTANDWHNLALLETLYELHENFSSHAQSINELFYFYVQNCTETGEDFSLNHTDVYRVLEVVTILQQLRDPIQEKLE
ncbi:MULTISPECIES: hypothetical protein [unclassified Myroides]|uniref:hypothetical protein n=1 Tax=unclassified Myroides TaxID=2642485 RepID=UPI003D2F5578